MALPTWARRSNIRRSFFKVIRDRFEAAGFPASDPGRYTGKVSYGDPLFDPTGLDQRLTSLTRYVIIRVVSFGIGHKLPTLFQVDLYTKLGTLDQSVSTYGADRYSDDLDAMADDFKGIWYPSDEGIKVYDFATPSSPADTGAWMISQGNNGKNFGLPSDETDQDFEKGLWNSSLTYGVFLDEDMQPGQTLYFEQNG